MTDTQQAGQEPAPQGPFKGRTANRLYRWASIGLVVVGVILAILIFAGQMIESGELPDCDSDRARNTLSDVLKANDVEATAYDRIDTESTGKDEVACSAVLSLKDGGKLDLGYRFFWTDKKASYEITSWTKQPA